MFRVLTSAVMLVLTVSAVRAETSAPLGPADLVGARSLAVAGPRGLAPGNDGIFFNAAALAARRRYALEFQYLNDRKGSDTAEQWFGLSVVDSTTSAFTGGVGWTRFTSGQYVGNLFGVSAAAQLGQGFFGGTTAKYFSIDGPGGQQLRAVNGDASLFWVLNDLISLGVSGYNLLPSSNRQIAPRGMGAGLSVGTERTFQLMADWRADFDRRDQTAHSIGAGAEVLLADMVPLRAGYQYDDILGGQWLSFGAGIVASNGVALDLSYRQSLDDSTRRTLAAALKVFLTQ